MAVWDVAMAPVRAFGGAFNELDKAMQGRDAGQEKRQRQLLNDLQIVQQTTPENTPARIEQTREILKKHGMTMPPMQDAAGANPYEQIPTPYERGMGEYAKAKAGSAGALDPVKKAKAVAELMGSRPWSGEEGDTYDPNNPEHHVWMQSLQELGGSAPEETASPSPAPHSTATPPEPGSALRSVQTPGPSSNMPRTPGAQNQWAKQQHQEPTTPAATPWGEEMTPSPSEGEPAALSPKKKTPSGGGVFSRMAAALGRATPTGSIIPQKAGSALDGLPSPSPEQVDAAMTQVEGAGMATVRNAPKVAGSKAASTGSLKAAAQAIKAYKASPEYVEMTRQTGRLLNETDLSGPAKDMLSGQSAADQKRLLKLIHKHGEAKVLAGLQGSSKPKGNF